MVFSGDQSRDRNTSEEDFFDTAAAEKQSYPTVCVQNM